MVPSTDAALSGIAIASAAAASMGKTLITSLFGRQLLSV